MNGSLTRQKEVVVSTNPKRRLWVGVGREKVGGRGPAERLRKDGKKKSNLGEVPRKEKTERPRCDMGKSGLDQRTKKKTRGRSPET